MKKFSPLAAIVISPLLVAGVALAQSHPFAGTWKLNTAKSKYTAGAPPKEETVTVETKGSQEQLTLKGMAANGTPIANQLRSSSQGREREDSLGRSLRRR